MDTLKQCPLCGTSAKIYVTCDYDEYFHWLRISCTDNKCGCTVDGKHDFGTPDDIYDYPEDEIQEIIKRWNSRTA